MRRNRPVCLLPTAFALALAALIGPAPSAAQWIPDGVPLCTAPYMQDGLVAMPDGVGGVYFAWLDARGVTGTNPYANDIYLLRLTGQGTVAPGWPTQGLAVCTAPDNQWWPQLAPDGAGGVLVFWQDDRVGPTQTDIYAQRVSGSGTIDPGWTANGERMCGADRMQYLVGAVPDGAGGAIAVWVDYRSTVGGTDLYAQRIGGDGTLAPGWPIHGAAVCVAANEQSHPTLAPDGSGGVYIGWSDQRDGGDAQIYALRLDGTGAPAAGWAVDGTPISVGVGDRNFSSIAFDGTGGAILGWSDRRNGLWQLFGQRMTATGNVSPGWPPNGRLVCAQQTSGETPAVVSDGAGGAFFVWSDLRAGTGFGSGDLYAMRLDGGGSPAPGWTPDGNPVCALPWTQFNPCAVSDGAGGIVVAWQDARASSFPSTFTHDIYAQRLLPFGQVAAGWDPLGVAMCTAQQVQQHPIIASDGAGGAFVAWLDSRNPTPAVFDLYAMRTLVNGPVPVLVSTSRAEVVNGRVRLEWVVRGHEGTFHSELERSEDGSGWSRLAELVADGEGRIEFEDADVRPGAGYLYRLRFVEAGRVVLAGEIGLTLPGAPGLSLEGLVPNPSAGPITAVFSLPHAAPATLEVIDLAGRRVLTHSVEGFGAGRHRLTMDSGTPLAPGVYLVRLSQSGRSVVVRGLVAP